MTPRRATRNDWTLDTNVLITANGPMTATNLVMPQSSARAPSRRQQARALLKCIGECGYLMWSNAVAQGYQARGAINLRSGNPPVPVAGQSRRTYCDEWLALLQGQGRIRVPEQLVRLTGAEQDKLKRAQFRDREDCKFLELARSSDSMRLVTEEAHFNRTTIKAIKRIVGVVCLDYGSAVSQCESHQ